MIDQEFKLGRVGGLPLHAGGGDAEAAGPGRHGTLDGLAEVEHMQLEHFYPHSFSLSLSVRLHHSLGTLQLPQFPPVSS